MRQGAGGRRRTFDRLADKFMPGKYDPPSFALRLAHKDVTLATELGREVSVPMRLANLALEELTEALNRGWGERDSRIAMLLQRSAPASKSRLMRRRSRTSSRGIRAKRREASCLPTPCPIARLEDCPTATKTGASSPTWEERPLELAAVAASLEAPVTLPRKDRAP